MSNVNVINNAGKDVVVTVNKENDDIKIIIDLESNKVKLSELKPGDVFKSPNGTEYILWYFLEDGSAGVLRKDLLEGKMKFGDNNNFDGSNVDKYLNSTYIKEIETDFGKENIIEHEIDLLSLDGEDDYGVIKRKVSIPTIDQYRKHKKTIGEKKGAWWWLSTPNSTPSGCGDDDVHCVNSDGDVGYGWYDDCGAVRPFFVLDSLIFVSCDNVN